MRRSVTQLVSRVPAARLERPLSVSAFAGPYAGGVSPGIAKWGLAVVLGLIVVVVVRLHELVPRLAMVRPALVLSTLGFGVLFAKSSAARRREVLRDPTLRWVLAFLIWGACTIPLAMWRGLALDTLRPVEHRRQAHRGAIRSRSSLPRPTCR